MAEKVTVLTTDDLDGAVIEDYDGPVEFGIDGVTYEIDLSDDNHEKLRASMADYVGHARKVGRLVGGAAGRARGAKAPNVAAAERKMRKDIREHFKDREITLPSGKKYTVGGRGRLPQEVIDMYLAEMADQVSQQASAAGASQGDQEASRIPAPSFSG